MLTKIKLERQSTDSDNSRNTIWPGDEQRTTQEKKTREQIMKSTV